MLASRDRDAFQKVQLAGSLPLLWSCVIGLWLVVRSQYRFAIRQSPLLCGSATTIKKIDAAVRFWQ